MLKNYLLIVWRSIRRHPLYATLNLTSLAIGIAATVLIMLYLHFEVNYDRFHTQADRLFRIHTEAIVTKDRVMEVQWPATPHLVGPYAAEDYPEVEQYVRFFQFFENDVVAFEYEGQTIERDWVMAVDSNVLDLFSYELMYGDPKTALKEPNQLLLTESLARSIFGERNPVGEILTTHLRHAQLQTDDDYTLEVAGVYKDLPDNTHLPTQALLSAETDPYLADYYFKRFNCYTYLLLKEGTDVATLTSELSGIYERHLDPEIEPVMASANHRLVPITNIHAEMTGGYVYIYTFVAVALLMLLIAVISYINLATAQAGKRAMEVGVRKVMGSSRKQLIGQFLTESVLFALLGLVLGLAIVNWVVEPVNAMLDLQLRVEQLFQTQVMLGMLGIVMVLGLIGGSYPAFFLSAFQPVAVMKGQTKKGAPLRKTLVTIQFVIVIFVLTCTGLIYDQLQFLRQKDLGFDQSHLLNLNLMEQSQQDKWPVLRQALLQHPNISAAGSSSFVPGYNPPRRPVSADGAADREPQFCYFASVDSDYWETIGVSLTAGRNFAANTPSDSTQNVIVNQAFLRNFGLEEPAIGERIRWGDQNNPNHKVIIGVIEDFHQSSLHHPISSQVYTFGGGHRASLKVDGDLSIVIDQVEKSWTEVFPNIPFDYYFLDEELQQLYEADQTRGLIFFTFSLLTIFISFLGLFGLAAYMARQRVREMGIRKILGAGLWDLLLLMTKEFMLLVLIAAIPAFVSAWYIIERWLEEFAFQANTNYALLGVILLATLLLTFVTTGLQALKAARLNPSETLKYE